LSQLTHEAADSRPQEFYEAPDDGQVAGLDTPIAALKRARLRQPHKVFLEFAGEDWTYQRFTDESARLAHGLSELGIRPGDRVAAFCDNNPDMLLLWFGANMIGAIYVPINTSYKGEFLRHQLADCGARLVLTEGHHLAAVLAVAADLPELTLILDRDGRSQAPASGGIAIEAVDAHRANEIDPPDHAPTPDDLACLVYTSGTTGRSKGCALTHHFLCHVGHEFNRFSSRTADEHNWTALPLFHLNAIAGSVVGTILLGSSASFAPRFSLSSFWSEVERTKPGVVYLVGSMTPLIAKMDDSPEMERSRGIVRCVIAAPFPINLQKVFRERFGVAFTGGSGWGQTEVGMPLMLPPTDGVNERASATNGIPVPDFDVRIVDGRDQEVKSGTVGEIVVRPRRPYIMYSGYWGRSADTLKAWRNLWYHSGDLGKVDSEGYFHFIDRKDDYLRRGGENISSFEVERILGQHTGVAEVAVHAVPSELAEDEVKATIVPSPDNLLTEEELYLWAADQLPHFATPRYIEFRPELPKNPVGRVLKHKLRAEGLTLETWDRQEQGFTARGTRISSNGTP
jgi:crotonobetaine/carnitine-CoA ligase